MEFLFLINNSIVNVVFLYYWFGARAAQVGWYVKSITVNFDHSYVTHMLAR